MRDYIKIKNRAQRLKQGNFSSGVNYALDESVMPTNVAADCANFEFSDGALKQSWGVKSGSISNALAVWDFRRFDFDLNEYITYKMFMKADGSVWYLSPSNGEEIKLKDVKFTSPPMSVNYRIYGEDVIIMCSSTDHMVVWNGLDDPYTVLSSPFISSMAMHYERLFVTTEGEKNSVWFSDDLDPTNWNSELNEGGYIQLIDDRGRCNKVISFLNYIYIFRDNGISRLTAYGDQTEFYISNLFVSSGKIYADTVTLCGDRIYFLASDGLYRFDGLTTDKILSNLDDVIEGGTPYAAYYDGKYFLALRLKDENELRLNEENGGDDEDKTVNNGLIVIGQDEYSVVRGLEIDRLCPTEEGLYAALGNGLSGIMDKNGALFDKPLHKIWNMPESDFGYVGLKILKEIQVSSTGDAKITVKSDFNKKEFTISEGNNRLFVNLMGRTFKISIESDEKYINVNRFSCTVKR